MTELVPSPNHLAIPGNAHFSVDFFLTPGDILKLSNASNNNKEQFPCYELQLRVFLLEINANSVEQQQQQKDAFPPNSVVNLDGKNVILPVRFLSSTSSRNSNLIMMKPILINRFNPKLSWIFLSLLKSRKQKSH
jgi:thioester reductase-like protein